MDITIEDYALIRRVPLFSDLSVATMTRVIDEGGVFRYPRGTVLFQEGEMPGCMHVVLQGEVGLIGHEGGEETVVEIMRPGELFLAAAVLTDRPYLMSAKVLQPARLLLVPGDRLRAMLRDDPDLAIAMLGAVSRHFRMLVREVKSLKLKSSAQRLAGYLMTLTDRSEGRVVIRLPHSKNIVAQRVGIRPETLSRVFATLKEMGVVMRGKVVDIKDVARLSAFCRDEAIW